jgi:hypothetical protein
MIKNIYIFSILEKLYRYIFSLATKKPLHGMAKDVIFIILSIRIYLHIFILVMSEPDLAWSSIPDYIPLTYLAVLLRTGENIQKSYVAMVTKTERATAVES